MQSIEQKPDAPVEGPKVDHKLGFYVKLNINIPNYIVKSAQIYVWLQFTEDDENEVERLKESEMDELVQKCIRLDMDNRDDELKKVDTLSDDERASFTATLNAELSDKINRVLVKYRHNEDVKLLNLRGDYIDGKIQTRPPGSTTEDWMKSLGLLS